MRRKKHWMHHASDYVTACGRAHTSVAVVEGNPEAVTCGQCLSTRDYRADLIYLRRSR